MKSNCEYIEKAVADSRQGVVLQLRVTCSCEHGNIPSVSMRVGKFLDYVRDYYLL
jgi:hypothetical protein